MDYSALMAAIGQDLSPASDPFFQLGSSILKQPEQAPLVGNRSFWGGFLPTATSGFLGGAALGYGKANSEAKSSLAQQEMLGLPSDTSQWADYLAGTKELKKIPQIGAVQLALQDEERQRRASMAEKGLVSDNLSMNDALQLAGISKPKPIGVPAFPTTAAADQYQTPADPAAAAAMAGGATPDAASGMSEIQKTALLAGLSPEVAAQISNGKQLAAAIGAQKSDDAFTKPLVAQIATQKEALSGVRELYPLLEQMKGMTGPQIQADAIRNPQGPAANYINILSSLPDKLTVGFGKRVSNITIKRMVEALDPSYWNFGQTADGLVQKVGNIDSQFSGFVNADIDTAQKLQQGGLSSLTEKVSPYGSKTLGATGGGGMSQPAAASAPIAPPGMKVQFSPSTGQYRVVPK